MNRVSLILSVCWALATCAGAAQSGKAPVPARAAYNFNPGWKLCVGDPQNAAAPEFDDSAWEAVTLPHAWNEDSAFKVAIQDLPTGVAWYRKHFRLPADALGKKCFLEFQGIRQGGDFYLNGQWIGRSENGVMAFGFDITDKVNRPPAENVLAARIDNSWRYPERDTGCGYEWNDHNFYANYGGINKNVVLHLTDRLYQTLPLYSNLRTLGVYVYAQDIDIAGHAATLTAQSQVKNDYSEPRTFRYAVTLSDAEGKLVQSIQGGEETLAPGELKTVSARGRVSNLRFWSWGYGYLYDVVTTLRVDGQVVDTVLTRTGFRKTEFAHGMFKLNERALHLKGYAQRSTDEWPAVGSGVPPWMSDFSEGLMVQSGASLVRWMHVTPWKQSVEACDRVGLLQAMPAGDSERDATGRAWQQRVELMRDALIYNRNNPSIVFLECGNNQISEAHMAEMKVLRDQFDPYGGRAIGSRNMLQSTQAEYGGEMLYVDKSASKPLWMMEYSRDEGLRKYWDSWSPPFHADGSGPARPNGESAAPYNRNQDSQALENVFRWFDYWSQRPGTGERVNAGGVNIYFSDSNTHFRGAAAYRCSGEVDAMRLPKEGFFAHQVMWNDWVNPKPAIHIIGHWNYSTNVSKPIYVVSSAEKVELFINGRSQGFGRQSAHFLFTWESLPFQPGAIQAVGYNARGKRLCQTVLKTAGQPSAIRLTAHTGPAGLRADGADLALVDAEVVDAHGNRCPTAFDLLEFSLQGPAEWRGGIATGPIEERTKTISQNFILSRELPVECGINRVILRSRRQAGRILVHASAKGLKPASLQLLSTPFEEAGGLSKTFPDAELSAGLQRGPTPAADSILPTRRNIRILSATAGSHPEKAQCAFDDNEATSWSADGRRGTGWIEFTLERPGTPSEATLKLNAFRRKAYPLRITVDGKIAFEGTTPKSLGYVTLPLKPTPGQTVRLELVGAIEDKDAFGMVEVAGKKLGDESESSAPEAWGIIEAEFYEPLAEGGN